jgi:hypothetical protein
MQKWVIYGCDCSMNFALPKNDSIAFPPCPYCGSEDTTMTGEVIKGEVVFDNEDEER